MHRFAPYKETQFAIRVHLSKRDVKTKQKEEFQLGKSHTVGSERGWGLRLIVLRMHGDKEVARQRFPTCTSPLSSVWHSCVLQRTLSRLISQPFTSIVIFVLTTMGGNLFPWLSPSLPRGTPHIHVTSFNYKTPHSNSGVAKKKKKERNSAAELCLRAQIYAMWWPGHDRGLYRIKKHLEMRLMNAERIWFSFMLRLVLCKWGAHRCGGEEGRERKDCMPATVGVPPVSSGTEDPFNLSTMPRKKHASPRGLCHPSAKKNQNIPHSGFAFETDDLTYTTWFSNPFFSLRLFLNVNVTQSGPLTPQHLPADQMQI